MPVLVLVDDLLQVAYFVALAAQVVHSFWLHCESLENEVDSVSIVLELVGLEREASLARLLHFSVILLVGKCFFKLLIVAYGYLYAIVSIESFIIGPVGQTEFVLVIV